MFLLLRGQLGGFGGSRLPGTILRQQGIVVMRQGRKRWVFARGVLFLAVLAGMVLAAIMASDVKAGATFGARWCGHWHGCCDECGPPTDDIGGTWCWLRSEDEEKRVVEALFNRYCIRCHGVDGRGVWDIPGVPDFTNPRWQASRSDAQRARIILEGRGAVMPPFRGALTLEEAWAIGRYLHTFVPGTEVSRPDLTAPPNPADAPAPKKAEPPVK
jgi:hypothetical protein